MFILNTLKNIYIFSWTTPFIFAKTNVTIERQRVPSEAVLTAKPHNPGLWSAETSQNTKLD